MSLLERPTGEGSIWDYELRRGGLPPVCVSSGGPALGTMNVQYQNSEGDALRSLLPGGTARTLVVRGQLPMSTTWSLAVIVARLLLLVALGGLIYTAVTVGLHSNAILLGALLLFLGYLWLYRVIRALLEPSGDVHVDPSGRRWVRLHRVHPNFVAAVEAARAAAAAPQST